MPEAGPPKEENSKQIQMLESEILQTNDIAAAGYLGGVLAPIIGMWLVDITPAAGFFFWGGCYMLSAVLFLFLKETGPRVRQA